jgi:hypothetical protein
MRGSAVADEATVVSSDEDVAKVVAADRAEKGGKDWGAAGQVDRSDQVKELQEHPELINRLHNMIHGEINAASTPEVRRIQMESALNRSYDRDHSVEQVLRQTYQRGDSGYYPGTTYGRKDYGNYSSEDFLGDLKAVAAGSNYGGKYMPPGVLVTGNASGDVAKHQFARGTPGFSIQTASGAYESYFAEPGASGRTPMIKGHNTGMAPEDAYNTVLPEFAEKGFQSWMKTQSKTTGRDLNNDLHDYDLRGYFKENGAVNLSGTHLTDKYKKPNHPTFSTNSIYDGVDGNQGGQWTKAADGSWDFYASPTNEANMSGEALKSYFDEVEPRNRLHSRAQQLIESGRQMSEDDSGGLDDPQVLAQTGPMFPGKISVKSDVSNFPESGNIDDRRQPDSPFQQFKRDLAKTYDLAVKKFGPRQAAAGTDDDRLGSVKDIKDRVAVIKDRHEKLKAESEAYGKDYWKQTYAWADKQNQYHKDLEEHHKNFDEWVAGAEKALKDNIKHPGAYKEWQKKNKGPPKPPTDPGPHPVQDELFDLKAYRRLNPE